MTKHTKSMGFPTEQLSHSHTYLIYTRYVMLFFFFLVFNIIAGDIRDTGLIPGSGGFHGGGHGNPLLYSCLENPMDRGAGRAVVHRGHEESDTTEVT